MPRTVIALIAAVCIGGCGNEAATLGPSQDAGIGHIHGLGVNPADGSLMVATHTGLFRVAPGERALDRVGSEHRDTMRFTVVGPNRVLGSGHPDARSDRPLLLGLIRSQGRRP
jgi:hypothetical protein